MYRVILPVNNIATAGHVIVSIEGLPTGLLLLYGQSRREVEQWRSPGKGILRLPALGHGWCRGAHNLSVLVRQMVRGGDMGWWRQAADSSH